MKKKRLHIKNIAALESYWTDFNLYQFGYYFSGYAFFARDGYLLDYDEIPFDEFPVFQRSKLSDFVHDLFVYQCTKYHNIIKISPKYV